MNIVDYTMYYVTDRNLLHKKYTLSESVEASILGGATIIQLREKDMPTKEFYQEALEIKEICQKYDVPLLINDRIDVALAIEADGVHIGQEDMPLTVARKILGADKIIGVSTGTLEEALEAEKNGADYVGVGAMYSTATKKDADVISIEELTKIKKHLKIPVTAIGGINQKTIPSLYPAQVDSIAVVSAISMQEDTTKATRELKNLFLKQYETQAYIFDFDGTLFETVSIWDNVIKKIAKKYNFPLSKEFIHKIWSMQFVDSARYTVEKFGLPISPEEYFQEVLNMSVEEYKRADIRLKKGAKEYLQERKKAGKKIVGATALSARQYEVILEKVGIREYFDLVASAQDLGMPKTKPDIFHWISEKIGVNEKNCIVFEDDIHSATGIKGAGMKMCLMENAKFKDNHNFDRYFDYRGEDFEQIGEF